MKALLPMHRHCDLPSCLRSAALAAIFTAMATGLNAAPRTVPLDGIRLVSQETMWSSLPLAIAANAAPFLIRDTSTPAVVDFARLAAAPNVEVVTGDFNGDGLTDIALLNRTDLREQTWTTMPVAYANADGTVRVEKHFIGQFAFDVRVNPGQIVVGDFNGDGRADLALVETRADLVSFDGRVPVLLSQPDGSFYPSGWGVNSGQWTFDYQAQVVPGNFAHNPDGLARMDIALLRPCQTRVTTPVLYTGPYGADVVDVPSDTFEYHCPMQGTRVMAGDFNGDGLSDLAKFTASSLIVAIAMPMGGFAVTSAVSGPFLERARNSTILLGRFDAGPTTDIALVDRSGARGGLYFAFADANAQFTIRMGVALDFGAWAAAPGATPLVGDFDGNGLTDIAMVQAAPGTDWATVPIAYSFMERLSGGRQEWRMTVQNQPAPGFVERARAPSVRMLVGKFGR